MEKPNYQADAQFTSSTVGLDENTKYFAVLVDSSANDQATTPDNRNLILATVPVSGTEPENIKSSDWVNRTASSRALVGAGVASEAQKKAAMTSQQVFIVSWTANGVGHGKDRNGNETTYTRKSWTAKRYNEGAE